MGITAQRPGHTVILLVALATCIVTLSGCETSRRSAAVATKLSVEKQADDMRVEKEAARMAQCQKELEALEGISPAQHKTYKAEFGQLMSGAAQYAGLRTQVSDSIQETMDALYRYKVNRLCADITQAALTGLVERGERFK